MRIQTIPGSPEFRIVQDPADNEILLTAFFESAVSASVLPRSSTLEQDSDGRLVIVVRAFRVEPHR